MLATARNHRRAVGLESQQSPELIRHD